MVDPCTQFLDQLEQFLDGECGPETKAKVEDHMKYCPPCHHRADFEDRLRAIVKTSCRESAPEGLMQSVMQKLNLA